jgi:hypothetical protein
MGMLSVSVQVAGVKSPAELRFGGRGSRTVSVHPYKGSNVEAVSDIIQERAKWKAPHFENGLLIRGAASISTSSSGMKVPSW